MGFLRWCFTCRQVRWCVLCSAVFALLVGAATIGFMTYPELAKRGCLQFPQDVVPLQIEPAAPDVVRFVALGDTGGLTPRTDRVMAAVRQVCAERGCDFVMLLGDLLYPKGAASFGDPQFEGIVERYYQPLGVPVLSVLGNHDIKHDGRFQLFYSLRNDRWRMPNYSYRFQAGPARLVAANTNCGLLEWSRVADEVAEPFDGQTVVFGHHPIYSNGPHGSAGAVTRWYWEHYLADRVDYLVAAHNHDMEYLTEPGRAVRHVISGAGGRAVGEAPEPEGGPAEADSRFAYFQDGFAYFEVRANRVDVRFYGSDGTELRHIADRRGNDLAPMAVAR